MIFGKKKPDPGSSFENPYIKSHKLKNYNDEIYADYLEWLKKEGRGVPIEKVQSFEDW